MRCLSVFKPQFPSRPRRVGGVFCLFLAAALWVPASAQESGNDLAAEISRQVRRVFDKTADAVVKITATDGHGKLSGSGFFIDPMGTIYTAYSVGGEADEIIVQSGEKKYPARRLMADPRSGIAILKIDREGTPFIQAGHSDCLSVTSPVVSVGFPMDLPMAPTFGLVAGFDLKYLGRFFVTRHIRANVQVQRGQGGAPLLNMDGEVVGILVSSLDGGAGCFALPIEAAEKVRDDFVRFGEIRQGWIGVTVESTTVSEAGSSVRVADLLPGTPAVLGGLHEGDVLLQIGRVPVRVPEDVLEASFYLTTGTATPVVVWRNGERMTMELSPQDHPDRARIHAHIPDIPGPGSKNTLPLSLPSNLE